MSNKGKGDLSAYLETLFSKCIGKRVGTNFSESCQVCGFKSGCEKFYKAILRRIQQRPKANEVLIEKWKKKGRVWDFKLEDHIEQIISDVTGKKLEIKARMTKYCNTDREEEWIRIR